MFKNDDTYREYSEFINARKEFSQEDRKMTGSIKKKTIDPDKVEYDKVHVEVYSGVSLGEAWRVNDSIKAEEIQRASEGFRKVTKKFDSFTEKQESSSILTIIKRLFNRG